MCLLNTQQYLLLLILFISVQLLGGVRRHEHTLGVADEYARVARKIGYSLASHAGSIKR